MITEVVDQKFKTFVYSQYIQSTALDSKNELPELKAK